MIQTTTEATMAEDTAEGLKDAIRVDTAELRGHVDAVVRSSVDVAHGNKQSFATSSHRVWNLDRQ